MTKVTSKVASKSVKKVTAKKASGQKKVTSKPVQKKKSK